MNLKVNHTVKHWLTLWEKQPKLAWTFSILWLLLISWLAFLWNLGNTGLVDETEPLFAEASRQMTVTGDWITPYYNGATRFDKPILIYWLQAIGYKLIGVNEWAVRLPSALAGVTLTGLGFYTLRYFGIPNPGNSQEADPEKQSRVSHQLWLSAWIGAALIALNPETIVWGHIGVSDMLLSGCMGSALLAFFLGYAQVDQPVVQGRWYIAFYVLVALAVLTKGPVGIVVPGLIITAFLLYVGLAREVIREMRLVRGLLIMAAIALPWYVLVILANGETYIQAFFGLHNFQRFTGVVNHHSAQWYFYFLVVLVGFMPWSIYLPVAIARIRFWQRPAWCQQPRTTHLGLFALFWFAGIFGFFTIAVTKLPSYVLPLMPAAAILVALFWSDQMTRTSVAKGNALLWSGLANVLFLAVISSAIVYSPNFIGFDPAAPNLRELVQQSGLPIIGGVIWAATAVGALLLLLKRQWQWLWGVNLIGFVAFIIFVVTPATFLMDHARQLPIRELATIVTQVEQPGEELIMVGFEKPTLVFYTKRHVNFFSNPGKAVQYIEAIATTKPKPLSLLILIQPKKLPELGLEPNQYQTLGIAGAYQLIRVSKQVVASLPVLSAPDV
jgi:4-amino-4-deoxy-L-arabinose transferase-like glycosyltransferase